MKGLPVSPCTGIVPGRTGPDFNVSRALRAVKDWRQVQLMVLSQGPQQLPPGQRQFVDENQRIFHRSLHNPVVDAPQAGLVDHLAQGDIKNLHAHGRIQPAIQRLVAAEEEFRRHHRQFIRSFIPGAGIKNTAAGAAEREQGDQQAGGVQLHHMEKWQGRADYSASTRQTGKSLFEKSAVSDCFRRKMLNGIIHEASDFHRIALIDRFYREWDGGLSIV